MENPTKLNQKSFTVHLMNCADITNQVAERLGLKDDQAKQACFATITIGAQHRGLSLNGAKTAESIVLLELIQNACGLLNAAGWTPPFTKATLNEFAATELATEAPVEQLPAESLRLLLKTLSDRLDALKVKGTTDTQRLGLIKTLRGIPKADLKAAMDKLYPGKTLEDLPHDALVQVCDEINMPF